MNNYNLNEEIHFVKQSVNSALDMLSEVYSSLIFKKLKMNLAPSVMLWGAPGVGKSQLVYQLAENLESSTGRKVVVTDVRLMLYNPIDLRGIPTANPDKTLAVWLKPKVFDMDESSGVINILFLDEISACTPSVQAAAYQITLDRVIGEHRLPDNCIVIAAGNRGTDKSVSYRMPNALANRLCHFEIVPSFSSWVSWAEKNSIDSRIINFLRFRNDRFYCEPENVNELVYPTPRSWEMASNFIRIFNGDADKAKNMIMGCVGISAAMDFFAWCRSDKKIPDTKDIFAGKNPEPPTTTDEIYAMVSSMVSYAAKHTDDLNQIANAIEYTFRIPADFSFSFVLSLMNISSDFSVKLLELPAYKKWIEKRGRMINGIV